MFDDITFKGFSIGIIVGTVVTGLALHRLVKQLMTMTQRSDERHKATFDYVVKKMGPYAPSEILNDILVYVKANDMEIYEEGLSL